MKIKDVRIVFMGTPEFALPSLKALLDAEYNVIAVITSPDRGSGRGQKIKYSPVKQFALSNGIVILQPENLKDIDFISHLKNLKPDLQIVIAFRMLPKEVWSIPRFGTFNLHASLLPKYRGATPINHAIINGEKESGLTTFFIDDKIDTGEIIDQIKINISNTESFGELHDRMKNLSSKFILNSITKVISADYQLINQDTLLDEDSKLILAPKISKEYCKIDWNKPLNRVYNFIRGLSPYPAAYGFLSNDEQFYQIKIFKTEMILKAHNYLQGTIYSDGKTYMHVALSGGFLDILDVQLMGKQRMIIKDFLNGYRFSSKTKFIID